MGECYDSDILRKIWNWKRVFIDWINFKDNKRYAILVTEVAHVVPRVNIYVILMKLMKDLFNLTIWACVWFSDFSKHIQNTRPKKRTSGRNENNSFNIEKEIKDERYIIGLESISM
jgi:hypothetical protein